MPLVSIIVPVYNAERYVAKTIESVLNQTFTDYELILINDCSTDNSLEIIEPYLKDERIRLINNETNLRAAKSRNKGIDLAQGRYIAYIDADDLWLPEKLSEQLKFMKEQDCAFSCTAYEFGDDQAVGTGRIVKVLPRMNYRKALSRTIIFTSTVMMDSAKISKELMYMPNVPSEDTACWWQILRNGFDVYGCQKVLTIYRRPAESLSSNKKVALYRIWNLYRNIEGLGVIASAVNFVFWAIRATLRRI